MATLEQLFEELEDIEFTEMNMDLEPFIKQEEDDRLLCAVDSPSSLGSPDFKVPPSPALTEGYQSSDDDGQRTPPPATDPLLTISEEDAANWMSEQGLTLDGVDWLEMSPNQAMDALSTSEIFDIPMLDEPMQIPNGDSRANGAQPKSGTYPMTTELDEEELMSLPVKELNMRLKGLPKAFVLKIKQKRRTLKNRGYAQNCRSKRIKQKVDLEKENDILRAQLKHTKQQMQLVLRERDAYRRQFDVFRKHRANSTTLTRVNTMP